MKMLLPIIVALGTFFQAAQAGPLRPAQIPSDAKWVVHVDVDRLLKTKLGEYVAREFLEKKLAEPVAKLKTQLGADVDWRKIHSLTAYGWEIKNKGEPSGVLMIQSDLELPTMIDRILTKLETQVGAAQLPVQKIEDTAGTIYQLKEQAFGIGLPGGVFVLTRDKEHLLSALEYMDGRAAKRATSARWRGLDNGGDAFLVLGVAEGLVELDHLPKQAHVLKDATGGRLMAGEKADNVFVSLAVDTKTAETATQIQQLLQGLIALANLNGNENADLQKLAQGARVEGREKQVTLALEFPSRDLISHLNPEQRPKKRSKAATQEN